MLEGSSFNIWYHNYRWTDLRQTSMWNTTLTRVDCCKTSTETMRASPWLLNHHCRNWRLSFDSLQCHQWWSSSHRVATGLAKKKNSLTFPWLPTQVPVTVTIYTMVIFAIYSNHIEITSFINTCFNIVVLKIGQHKGTFSTSWKFSISCAEHYAKHEKNKVRKNQLANNIWMGT